MKILTKTSWGFVPEVQLIKRAIFQHEGVGLYVLEDFVSNNIIQVVRKEVKKQSIWLSCRVITANSL